VNDEMIQQRNTMRDKIHDIGKNIIKREINRVESHLKRTHAMYTELYEQAKYLGDPRILEVVLKHFAEIYNDVSSDLNDIVNKILKELYTAIGTLLDNYLTKSSALIELVKFEKSTDSINKVKLQFNQFTIDQDNTLNKIIENATSQLDQIYINYMKVLEDLNRKIKQ